MLVGHNDISIDNKHRIFLPVNTDREKDDEVFLVYDNDISEYLLFPKKTIEEKISKLEELIFTAKNEQERREYKLLLYNFYKCVLKKCTVDSAGRIVLSDYFKAGDTVTAIGAKDHLILTKKKDSKVKK